MIPDYFRSIREYELRRVASILAPGSHLLELGAGAGWQSKQLEREGHEVFAVDVPSSRYHGHAVFPVVRYDGRRLPFESHSFDVVFSSNVLEHINDPAAVQAEIHRVLRADGLAIHVVPTTTWRLWTSLAHYPAVVKRVLMPSQKTHEADSSNCERLPLMRALRLAAWPHRHGETGSSLSELYWFSRSAWRRFFLKHGWEIVDVVPTGIFYTGYAVLGSGLNVDLRAEISRYLGSSTVIFVLK